MKRERRVDAWRHWHSISRGQISDETAAWLADVAKKLLTANDIKDATDRRLEIVRTVGLLGTIGFDGEAIRQLAAMPESDFPNQIVGNSPKAQAARQARLRDLVRLACNLQTLNDAAVDARIKRALISDD